MSQPADVPVDPVTPVDPVAPAAHVPPQTPVVPTPVIDDSATRAGLDHLQMQESSVAQILAIIDEAGREVSEGAPRFIDPDVFGGTREGERMARHTVRAQVRVQEALDLALEALHQHTVALSTFRDEVRRVEATTQDELAAVHARLREGQA